MRGLAFGALLVFAACRPVEVDYVGKQCAPDRACPDALVCNPFTWLCDTAATCPHVESSPPDCGGRDLYLSATGDDAETGLEAARPRRTPPPLFPGDRLNFAPGTWTERLALSGVGAPTCPITAQGPPDAAAIFSEGFSVRGRHWRIRELTVRAPNQTIAVEVPAGEDVVFDRVRFERTSDILMANGARDLWAIGDGCRRCAVVESVFASTTGESLFFNAASVGLHVRGNTFSRPVLIEAADAVVEGNTFTGGYSFVPALRFKDLPRSARVRRNVFHQLGGGGVSGAAHASQNTFVNVTGASSASDLDVFRGNLVMQSTAPDRIETGGYNLFEGGVPPYLEGGAGDPTDLTGAARLGDDFVPGTDSAAIDASDPAEPVPPGGGSRADVGARERGAVRTADGLYCLPR